LFGPSTFRAAPIRPQVLAALAALLVFAVTVQGTYVYDDAAVVRDDPRIGDVRHWGKLWTEPYFGTAADKLYRPLTMMTYALQWQLHGDAPAWFHAVNILLHALVSALVAELARRLTASTLAAGIAGVAFAVHPIHVEAVAGIVGRAELLCAAGIVGAMILALSPQLRPGHLVGIGVCTLVALLSKEQGMLLPPLVGVVLYLRQVSAPLPRKTILHVAVLLVWLLGLYIAVRESLIGFYWERHWLTWTVNPIVDSRGIDRVLMPIALLGRAVVLLVAPVRQSLDYGGAVIGSSTYWFDPYLLTGVGVIAASIAGLWFAWRRRALVGVMCILGFGLSFGMVSNFAAIIGTIFAERLLYLPSAFFLILLAVGLARLPRMALIPVLAIALSLGAWRTFTYASLWNDPIRLYETNMRDFPGSILIHRLVIDTHLRDGRPDEAWEAARQFLAHLPGAWEAYADSAIAAAARGDFVEAERLLKIAWDLHPELPVANAAERVEQFRRESLNSNPSSE
jgi:hypothetical protein